MNIADVLALIVATISSACAVAMVVAHGER
jgi:hypothetical protein